MFLKFKFNKFNKLAFLSLRIGNFRKSEIFISGIIDKSPEYFRNPGDWEFFCDFYSEDFLGVLQDVEKLMILKFMPGDEKSAWRYEIFSWK